MSGRVRSLFKAVSGILGVTTVLPQVGVDLDPVIMSPIEDLVFGMITLPAGASMSPSSLTNSIPAFVQPYLSKTNGVLANLEFIFFLLLLFCVYWLFNQSRDYFFGSRKLRMRRPKGSRHADPDHTGIIRLWRTKYLAATARTRKLKQHTDTEIARLQGKQIIDANLISSLEEQLAAASTENVNINIQLETRNEELRTANGELERQRRKASELQTEMDTTDATITNLRKERLRESRAAQAAEQRAESFEDELKRERRKNNQLGDEVADLLRGKAIQDRNARDLQKTLDSKLEGMYASKIDVVAANDRLTAEMDALKSANDALSDEKKTLQQDKDNMKEEHKQQIARRNAQETGLVDACEQESEEKDQKLKAAEEELAAVRKILQATEAEKEALACKADQLALDLAIIESFDQQAGDDDCDMVTANVSPPYMEPIESPQANPVPVETPSAEAASVDAAFTGNSEADFTPVIHTSADTTSADTTSADIPIVEITPAQDGAQLSCVPVADAEDNTNDDSLAVGNDLPSINLTDDLTSLPATTGSAQVQNLNADLHDGETPNIDFNIPQIELPTIDSLNAPDCTWPMDLGGMDEECHQENWPEFWNSFTNETAMWDPQAVIEPVGGYDPLELARLEDQLDALLGDASLAAATTHHDPVEAVSDFEFIGGNHQVAFDAVVEQGREGQQTGCTPEDLPQPDDSEPMTWNSSILPVGATSTFTFAQAAPTTHGVPLNWNYHPSPVTNQKADLRLDLDGDKSATGKESRKFSGGHGEQAIATKHAKIADFVSDPPPAKLDFTGLSAEERWGKYEECRDAEFSDPKRNMPLIDAHVIAYAEAKEAKKKAEENAEEMARLGTRTFSPFSSGKSVPQPLSTAPKYSSPYTQIVDNKATPSFPFPTKATPYVPPHGLMSLVPQQIPTWTPSTLGSRLGADVDVTSPSYSPTNPIYAPKLPTAIPLIGPPKDDGSSSESDEDDEDCKRANTSVAEDSTCEAPAESDTPQKDERSRKTKQNQRSRRRAARKKKERKMAALDNDSATDAGERPGPDDQSGQS
ncbi:MAG: hypothetical protein Q9216_006188 [Gyalolechia sp. 2 TL-2023]